MSDTREVIELAKFFNRELAFEPNVQQNYCFAMAREYYKTAPDVTMEFRPTHLKKGIKRQVQYIGPGRKVPSPLMPNLEYVTSKSDGFVLYGPGNYVEIIDPRTLCINWRRKDDAMIDIDMIKSCPQQKFTIYPCEALTKMTIWALIVPEVYKFKQKNSVYFGNHEKCLLPHHYGDLICCRDLNGKPDFKSLYVQNGSVFSEMYSMTPFSGVVRSKNFGK